MVQNKFVQNRLIKAVMCIILCNAASRVSTSPSLHGLSRKVKDEGLIQLIDEVQEEFAVIRGYRGSHLNSISTLVLMASIACSVASAQPAPRVAWQGVLRDAASSPIAGATITLATNGVHAHAVTGAGGEFNLTPLPAGSYRLTVETRSAIVEYAQPVHLAPVAPAVLLTLGGRSELTVAPLEEKNQPATGGEQLSSQAVSELPLNKRDFSSLLLLAAGTMTDANGATNFTAQFAINGQRGVEATFAMDGADISDPEMGGSTFSNFNVDAVEGIDSSSGWMPAEIGRGAAGFTNILTRSGASGFHGSVFEFVRNSAFDARNYFDHPTPAYPGRIPPFRRNEFGFTNGGPVFLPHLYDGRKRTFYFAQFQGFRQVLGTTQVMPVPTVAERGGIDPVTYPDGSTDTLTVPVDPGIAAVLARYPLPNYTPGSFGPHTYATASKVDHRMPTSSHCVIDHRPSPPKTSFMARFNLDNLSPDPPPIPTRPPSTPAFGIDLHRPPAQRPGAHGPAQYLRASFSSPLIGIDALHARLSHHRLHRPRRQIQRWPV
jgi:hypothetical protein